MIISLLTIQFRFLWVIDIIREAGENWAFLFLRSFAF